MKHRKGIDLARTGSNVGYTVSEGSRRGSEGSVSTEHTYRVEVWTDEPESGGELIETISLATDISVSMAAYKASVRARPGKILIHLNGRHRMSCEKAPDPPVPESLRPLHSKGRPHFGNTMLTG